MSQQPTLLHALIVSTSDPQHIFRPGVSRAARERERAVDSRLPGVRTEAGAAATARASSLNRE